MNDEARWTLKEAAQVAQVSRQTLQRAVQKGEIPVLKEIGTGGVHYLCRDADLQDWVSRRLQQTAPVCEPNPLEEELEATRRRLAELEASAPTLHNALAEAVQELEATRHRLARAEERAAGQVSARPDSALSDRVAVFVKRILGA